MSLNNDMRQNIQSNLDFSPSPTGEARRAGCVTNASVSSRCCTKDGSRPPEVGLQE